MMTGDEYGTWLRDRFVSAFAFASKLIRGRRLAPSPRAVPRGELAAEESGQYPSDSPVNIVGFGGHHPSETSVTFRRKTHKDVGKATGAKITDADIAKEKSKDGVYAKRAQFAENAKKWNHPGKGKR